MPPGRRGFHLANLARPFRNVVDNELGVFNKTLISLMNARDFKALEDSAAGLIRTKARFLAGDWNAWYGARRGRPCTKSVTK